MPRKLLVILVSISSLLCNSSLAQSLDTSIANQNQLNQQQQQLQQQLIRQRKLDKIFKEQEELKKEKQKDKAIIEEEILSEQDGKIVQDLKFIQCFRINKISFFFTKNKQIISHRQQKLLAKNYLKKCLNNEQIIELNNSVNNFLKNQGFTTSISTIPKQSLADKELELKIVEATINKIYFNENNLYDNMQKFMAFGYGHEGEILNIRNFDIGLDQINRLASNNAVIKVVPTNKKDSSHILIENKKSKSAKVNLTYDNNGNELTGSRRETIGFSKDNLLHLNDNFYISRTANDLDVNKDIQGTKSIYSEFSVPFKRHLLTISYSNSRYYFDLEDNFGAVRSEGVTSTKTISLDSILLKNTNLKLTLNSELTSRYNRNFISNVKTEESSRKASLASIGLIATFFNQNSTFYINPSIVKAINILNARRDLPDLSATEAHAEFELYKLYTNYSKNFKALKSNMNYRLNFDSQMSNKALYGIDQFAVGGIYSVRGFKNGSIAGDSGYNFRNELQIFLSEIIFPYASPKTTQKYSKYLNNFYITTFYDYGYARSKMGRQAGRLSGGGIKLGFTHKYFDADITFSKVISKSQYLLQDFDESKAIFFTLTGKYSFL